MKKLIVCFLSLLLLTGCAGQLTNVNLSNDFWQNHQQKIVVARAKAPEPELYQIGPHGVLDFAINESVTNQFRDYLHRTDMNWYFQLQQDFSNHLRARGLAANTYNKPIDENQLSSFHKNNTQYADMNYMLLAKPLGANELLLLHLKALGAQRRYYGFIPLGAPVAYTSLQGELIDLTTNRILWRHNASVSLPVEQPWDQPPNYPNFNEALNQAINMAKNEVMNSFFQR